MNYKIDYDADFWDVVSGNKRFTCYSEKDAWWLCELLNKEPTSPPEQVKEVEEQDKLWYYMKKTYDRYKDSSYADFLEEARKLFYLTEKNNLSNKQL